MPANRPARHQPTRHTPTRHEPGPSGVSAGPAVPKPGETTVTSIDWQTLVRGIGYPAQVPSYQFSNGRTFIQTADREI